MFDRIEFFKNKQQKNKEKSTAITSTNTKEKMPITK